MGNKNVSGSEKPEPFETTARAIVIEMLGYPTGYSYESLLTGQRAQVDKKVPFIAAALAAAQLTWTTDKPSTSGWYWYRSPSGVEMIVEHTNDMIDWRGEWAGPLEPPKERP